MYLFTADLDSLFSGVTCAAPLAVSFSTHAPILAVYDFSATISYACNLAYNHTAGNLTRACQQDFTWSGYAPVCNGMLFTHFLV